MYSTRREVEEDFFANINYSKNIECIVPTAEILINFRSNGVRTKKPCFVYAEKMEFKGLIQLRVTEKIDQRRMYITTVDSASFHELKQDQSLHVTFSGFIENLVHILQECQAGKLEINLVQLPTGNQNGIIGAHASDTFNITEVGGGSMYQLQFVEMRSFKNLVHLCLPSRLAPLNVVLFYMNSILDSMNKKLALQEHATQQQQHEIATHASRIEHLEAENAKLRESVLDTTRMLNQRHAEEVQQMQNKLTTTNEQRHSDNERNRKTISTLQAQLDKIGSEKSSLQVEKAHELKRIEALLEDLTSTRAAVATLKEQNEKLHAEMASIKNLERKNEMHLSDARKHIAELQENIKRHNKAQAEIVAELEAEKKISQTKRQALEMATEEISKGNEIILKQSQELIKLKKTISWRTEVALEQEKAINEKDRLLLHQQKTIENLRLEIPNQLESLRKFASSLELKYSEQICILKEKLSKLSPNGKENRPMSSLSSVPSSRTFK